MTNEILWEHLEDIVNVIKSGSIKNKNGETATISMRERQLIITLNSQQYIYDLDATFNQIIEDGWIFIEE